MAKINLDVDWKQYYKDHLVTIEEAAKHIEPGDVIFVGQASMIPTAFFDYLYEHKEEYHDVTIFSNVYSAPANMLFDHDTKKHFRLMSIYNLPLDRIALDSNIIEVLGAGYDQYDDALYECGCNTGAYQVCPPDEDGYCNAGGYGVTSCKTLMKAYPFAKTFGFMDATGVYPAPGPRDTHCVHITEFDYIIENNTTAMFIPAPQPTPVDEKIASYIIPYIKE